MRSLASVSSRTGRVMRRLSSSATSAAAATASSSGGTTRRPCTSVEALIERTGRATTIAPISWPP